MKTYKHLGKLLAVACLMLGLNCALHAEENKAKNQYIDEHPPVFTGHLSYRIEEESAWTDPELPYSADLVGSFDLGLTHPAANKYSLYVVKDRLLGFSNSDSQIQIYAKDASFSSLLSMGEPFDESIPLVPGTYVREGKTPFGNYRVTVVIEKKQLDIKEAKSGWTRYDTTYAPADIYSVKITKAEKF